MGLFKNIFGKRKNVKTQNNALTATKAFSTLMQCTADALDSKDQGIKTGIINPNWTTNEVISFLFAFYIYHEYEKTFSPIMAANFLKEYCHPEIYTEFKNFYLSLAQDQKVNLSQINFEGDILPSIDIPAFAAKSKQIGYKKHWNPFKEPYKSQWNNAFN